jgi:hypothetical protein
MKVINDNGILYFNFSSMGEKSKFETLYNFEIYNNEPKECLDFPTISIAETPLFTKPFKIENNKVALKNISVKAKVNYVGNKADLLNENGYYYDFEEMKIMPLSKLKSSDDIQIGNIFYGFMSIDNIIKRIDFNYNIGDGSSVVTNFEYRKGVIL